MDERSGGGAALLGMDGFVVLQALEEDGELFVLVETTADIVGCPSCGVRATGHGRSTVQVRDLPNGGRAVRLVWRKRRWLCRDPDCTRKSFTERSSLIERSLTIRAEREICRLVGQEGNSVASATRSFGVGWETAMGCVASVTARPWSRTQPASKASGPWGSTSTRCSAPTGTTTRSTRRASST